MVRYAGVWLSLQSCVEPLSANYQVVINEAQVHLARELKVSPLIEIRDGGETAADHLNEKIVAAKAGLELHHRQLRQVVSPKIHLRHDGRDFIGVCEEPKPIDSGPIRWSQQQTVCFFSDGNASPLEGKLVSNTYADFPVVTFEFVIRNPQSMDHPGGNWDLGAKGSVIIEDLSVHFSLAEQSVGGCLSLDLRETGQTFQATQRLEVYQASSGGENWKSQNHLDRHGKVPLEFRGYKVSADGTEHSGLRAEPVLRSANKSFEAAIACRDFWQNFPKTLAADHETLRIGLFPAEATGGTELQGGEQKTHQFAFELKSPGGGVDHRGLPEPASYQAVASRLCSRRSVAIPDTAKHSK